MNNGGIYAFIASIAAVLIAYLSGRHSQKKDDKAKIAKAEKKAEMTQKVAEVSSQSMYDRGRIEAEYRTQMQDIQRVSSNDVDELGRIAASQAQRAIEKGASEESR